MQAYYPSSEGTLTETRDNPATQHHGIAAPLVRPTELDPWTLYELEKETRKLSFDVPGKRGKEDKSTLPFQEVFHQKTPDVAHRSRKRVVKVQPEACEGIQQRIQTAKSKRKSLLMEVTVEDLFEERQTPYKLRTPCLDGSISSLLDIEDDDENAATFFRDDEEEDFHKSCSF